MKTAEDILIDNCPIFSSLFYDKKNKASVMMKESILKSMKEYAKIWVDRLAKDLSKNHGYGSMHEDHFVNIIKNEIDAQS